MKPWSFRKKFVVGLILIFVGAFGYRSYTNYHRDEEDRVSKNEILNLEISGVIMNGKKFLAQLKKYSKDESVKAIVIDINSPGGAVGPSQELYYELIRTKQKTKKPIVCVSTGLMASGGYYAALGCDKIVVAPGAMVGSIGVIMEFANLEKLYDWAKIRRYTIKTGKFKDAGSEYREMTAEERALMQGMVDDVLVQFKVAVAEGRKLPMEKVDGIADGRIFSGNQAKKLALVDTLGTLQDAIDEAGKMGGIEGKPKVYYPEKNKKWWMELVEEGRSDESDSESPVGGLSALFKILNVMGKAAGAVSAPAIEPGIYWLWRGASFH